MKLLVISALAAVTLLAGATGMLRTHTGATHVKTAGMPLMRDMQSAAGGDRLPVEDFDDRSLVFPREMKR